MTMIECYDDPGETVCSLLVVRDGLRQGRDMKKKVDGKSVRTQRCKKKMQSLRCGGDREVIEMMEVMDKQEQAAAWDQTRWCDSGEADRQKVGLWRVSIGHAEPRERNHSAKDVTATKESGPSTPKKSHPISPRPSPK